MQISDFNYGKGNGIDEKMNKKDNKGSDGKNILKSGSNKAK